MTHASQIPTPGFIRGAAMDFGSYMEYRGWEVREDEESSEAGYLVETLNEKPNTPHYEGYVSWLSEEKFNILMADAKNIDKSAFLTSLRFINNKNVPFSGISLFKPGVKFVHVSMPGPSYDVKYRTFDFMAMFANKE